MKTISFMGEKDFPESRSTLDYTCPRASALGQVKTRVSLDSGKSIFLPMKVIIIAINLFGIKCLGIKGAPPPLWVYILQTDPKRSDFLIFIWVSSQIPNLPFCSGSGKIDLLLQFSIFFQNYFCKIFTGVVATIWSVRFLNFDLWNFSHRSKLWKKIQNKKNGLRPKKKVLDQN